MPKKCSKISSVMPCAHLCCNCCPPPAEGSTAGPPGWQRCACAGSWWSGGWLKPCPADSWWPQEAVASWPAQRTQNSPYHAENEPHCEISLYAGSGDWEMDKKWCVRSWNNKSGTDISQTKKQVYAWKSKKDQKGKEHGLSVKWEKLE